MKYWKRRLASMAILLPLLCLPGCQSQPPQSQPPQDRLQEPESHAQLPQNQPEQPKDPSQPTAEELYQMRRDTLLEDLKGTSPPELLHAYCVGDGDNSLTGFLLHEDLPGLMDMLQVDQWQATGFFLSGVEAEISNRMMGIYLYIPPEGQAVETFDRREGSRVLHQIAINKEGDLAYNAFLQGDDRFFAYQMPDGTAQRVRDYVREHRVRDEEFYAMYGLEP